MEGICMLYSSIAIYASGFSLSLLLMFLYRKFVDLSKIKNSICRFLLKILCAFIVASPLIAIATLRFETGTDYEIYERFYQLNEENGINYFIRSDGTISELLFWIILECSRVVFQDVHGFFFLASTITLLLVFFALDRYKNKLNICLAYFVFLLVLFPTSLNIVRQMIAVAVVMYGLHFIEKNKRMFFIISVLIASLFHASAIFCLSFLAFFDYPKVLNTKTKRMVMWGVIILLPFLIMPLMDIASQVPFFAKYFSAYDIEFGERWGLVIKKIPLLILSAIYYKKIKKDNDRNASYTQMLFAQTSLYFVSFFTQWGFRLAYYLDFAQIILIPIIVRSERDHRKKALLIFGLILYYLLYYFYTFIIMNQDGTYPYIGI